MRLVALASADEVARRGATVVAEAARASVAIRGRFLLAVSGGSTPWRMLRFLASEEVPWEKVHLFQVDERVAPPGHPDRNLTHLRSNLVDRVAIASNHVHAMPVEEEAIEVAAARYAEEMRSVAGAPPVLDLVHLGLGADGHTASLVPDDPATDIVDSDVAATGLYGGYRRITLTYPLLARARTILWVVTGAEKGDALARLRRGDVAIPAGRVRSDRAFLLADAAALREDGAGAGPRTDNS